MSTPKIKSISELSIRNSTPPSSGGWNANSKGMKKQLYRANTITNSSQLVFLGSFYETMNFESLDVHQYAQL